VVNLWVSAEILRRQQAAARSLRSGVLRVIAQVPESLASRLQSAQPPSLPWDFRAIALPRGA